MQKNWQRLRNDPQLKKKILVREQVLDGIRAFFKQEAFHEVETPLLVKSPGSEPELEVFATSLKHLSGKEDAAYLLTSPEYAMKKLLVAGMGSIFQICKSFRNIESLGGTHNPEFTILEWYHTPGDYVTVMDDTEALLRFLYDRIIADGKYLLKYQGRTFDLNGHFSREKVADLFQKYLGITSDTLLSREKLAEVCQEKGFQVEADTAWDELYYQLFLNFIEPALAESDKPVFVYDYPAQQAALSKKKLDDPRFAERFELYLGGLELGNAFSELADADEQEARLRAELELRAAKGKLKYELDEDFIAALRAGLPPTGGIAVGVDRLVMLFADVADINDTLFFPAREMFAE